MPWLDLPSVPQPGTSVTNSMRRPWRQGHESSTKAARESKAVQRDRAAAVVPDCNIPQYCSGHRACGFRGSGWSFCPAVVFLFDARVVNLFFFFFFFFFFLRDLFPPAVSTWVPVHGAPASANTHGKAAAGGGRLPTRVGKEFVQGGFGPASTTLSAGEQLKQGCCKGSLRCDGQDATPPHNPRCPCRSPERGRHFCCTCACQQADESCCFRGPPAAYLEPEHNQAAAACPLELRVSLALFAAGGLGNNDAGMGICIGQGLAIPAEGTDERGINCELLPLPQGQPVADNLDAPGVLHGHIQVHISQAHIPGHTCASLAAHPGERALKGDGARGKDAGGGTRRSVITKHIKRPAASASPQCMLTYRVFLCSSGGVFPVSQMRFRQKIRSSRPSH